MSDYYGNTFSIKKEPNRTSMTTLKENTKTHLRCVRKKLSEFILFIPRTFWKTFSKQMA